jgi:hypothetical protein
LRVVRKNRRRSGHDVMLIRDARERVVCLAKKSARIKIHFVLVEAVGY